jgi:hypothetical protein
MSFSMDVDEDEKCCHSGDQPPMIRKLPLRDSKLTEMHEKLMALQMRMSRIQSKVVVVNLDGSLNSLEHPNHLSTIFECDDESGVFEEESSPFA